MGQRTPRARYYQETEPLCHNPAKHLLGYPVHHWEPGMGMKIAITGKGGVGKSSLAAIFAGLLAEAGERVLAVDADADPNLADALGVPAGQQNEIIPIGERRALIEERTGAKVKQFGQMFKLNPRVDDIASEYAWPWKGVDLLVLGAIEQGGSGCACPESVLLRALVSELVLRADEHLILDMEAGVEHLGRATARGVDIMLIIVEPGRRSLASAARIRDMAQAIGIERCATVVNRLHSPDDEAFVRQELASLGLGEPLACLPESALLRSADRDGVSVLTQLDEDLRQCCQGLLTRLRSFTTPEGTSP